MRLFIHTPVMASTDSTADRIEPQSGLEMLEASLQRLGECISEVLDHSGVHYSSSRGQGIVIVGWNENQWDDLPAEAAPAVGRARESFRKLVDLSTAVRRSAPDRAKELKGLDEKLNRLIEQPGGSLPSGAPAADIPQVREHLQSLLRRYGECVRRLPSAFGDGDRLLVADTSAVLDRPNLQEWKLDGEAWTLVLLPQLHTELDEKKRDSRTRETAQSVIKQIEEFDRRGDTFTGVKLSGKLSVREVPLDPDWDQTLPWLKRNHPDDLFIAGALELIQADLTARVALTASDRNLRNKARLAGLTVVRPNDL